VTAGAFVAGDAGRATDRAGGFLAAASPANKDRFVVEAVPRDFFPRKPPRVVLEPHVEPCAFEPVDDVVTVDSNVVALTEQLAPLVWSRDRRVFDGRTGVQPNGLQHVKVAQVGSDVPAWGLPKSSFNRLLRSEMEQHLRSMKKIRFVAQVQPKESVPSQ
jgi:hypothetical protein